MADTLLDEVAQRTNLAFSNQMEMLTFFLTDHQKYGINVFKIIEVIECPARLTRLPHSHEAIIGVLDCRGKPVNVIDLSLALGLERVDYQNRTAYIIVCEYSNSTHGFLIAEPDKLVNKSWEEIRSPTGILANTGCLTALTYDDNGDAIQILDVEKILLEIVQVEDRISETTASLARNSFLSGKNVLVIDDSRAARGMLQQALSQIGVGHTLLESAGKALLYLAEPGQAEMVHLIICDIEMPGLDGFTFTRRVKSMPHLAKIPLILHSSLSNQSNRLKAEQVGADGFLAKFQPDEVAKAVLSRLGA